MKTFFKILTSTIFSIAIVLTVLLFGNLNNVEEVTEFGDFSTAEDVTLPEEYTEVDYIVNIGATQWIDLEIKANSNHSMSFVFEVCSGSDDAPFFGASEKNVLRHRVNFVYNGFTKYINTNEEKTKNNGTYFWSASSWWSDYRVYAKKITISSSKYGATSLDEPLESDLTYYLFASNEDGTASITKRIVKIYDFCIYDENEDIVQHLVPCQRNSDGEAGLYDVTNDKFLGNSGTGVFYTNHTDHFVTKSEDVEIVEWEAEYNNYIESNTITIQGNGTNGNPYLVDNIYEFIHVLINYNDSKYVALTNDIIFNDGYFDGDTYVDGGDGKLYNFASFLKYKWLTFEGNGHKLIGFYSNKTGLVDANYGGGIFKNVTVDMCINSCYDSIGFWGVSKRGGSEYINITTYGTVKSTGQYVAAFNGFYNPNSISATNCVNYVNVTGGNCVSAFGRSGATIINCKNYGTITATNGNAYGFSEVGTINNCENYGEIVASGSACGIGGGEINNCKNYAVIKGTTACGITSSSATYINDCINYGDIEATTLGIGMGFIAKGYAKNCINYGNVSGNGAVGLIDGKQVTADFLGLINYGKITGKDYATGIFNSKINHNYGGRIFADCKNYGEIVAGNTATGIISCTNYGYKDFYCIKNCYNFGNVTATNTNGQAGGIVGSCIIGANKLYIIDCYNEGNITANSSSGYAGGIYGFAYLWNNEQRYIFIRCHNAGDLSGKYVGAMTSGTSTGQFTVTKCLNTGNITRTNSGNNVMTGLSSATFTSYVSSGKVNGVELKEFLGDDFSDYYCSWRTGELSLLGNNNTSLFQSQINKSWLEINGFTNKG